MQLTSGPNAVTLTPVRYQFPDMQPSSADGAWDWDANWLMIRGDVRDGDLGWSFTDPCLTTREAKELSAWLRSVAAAPAPSDSESPSFTEPNIGVRALTASNGQVQIAFHFSQESSPPEAGEDVRYGEGHAVSLIATPQSLLAAADEWDHELAAFPER